MIDNDVVPAQARGSRGRQWCSPRKAQAPGCRRPIAEPDVQGKDKQVAQARGSGQTPGDSAVPDHKGKVRDVVRLKPRHHQEVAVDGAPDRRSRKAHQPRSRGRPQSASSQQARSEWRTGSEPRRAPLPNLLLIRSRALRVCHMYAQSYRSEATNLGDLTADEFHYIYIYIYIYIFWNK